MAENRSQVFFSGQPGERRTEESRERDAEDALRHFHQARRITEFGVDV